MHNRILDALPEEYEGYLIRSDFRIGIQISQCMSDPELSKNEQIMTALDLLYGEGKPDIETALDGLIWFMEAGKPRKNKSVLEQIEEEVKGPDDAPEATPRTFDYDIDSAAIWGSFRKVYGIDLSRDKMHWWTFVALMDDLSECSLHKLIEIRTKKIDSSMSAQEKQYWTDAKARHSLGDTEELFSEEELENYRQFLMLTKGGE